MKTAFLVYLFLEVFVTITVSGKIGGLNTFLEIILSGIVGALLIMNFRKTLMQSLMAVMSKQVNRQALVAGNILALIGAVLLILPGFLSDIIGLLFQISILRTILASRINVPKTQPNHTHKGDDNVIDVEIIESNTHTK